MRLDGRRESNNFEDRRGMSGGTKAGMGIGGIILVGIITLLMGGNMGDVINNVGQQMSQVQEATPEGAAREFSEAEQVLPTGTGIYRRCLDRSVPEDGTNLSAPHPRAFLWLGSERVRRCNGCRGTVLLLGRPEAIHRPVVLHADGEAARSTWRLCAGIRHSSRSGPSC